MADRQRWPTCNDGRMSRRALGAVEPVGRAVVGRVVVGLAVVRRVVVGRAVVGLVVVGLLGMAGCSGSARAPVASDTSTTSTSADDSATTTTPPATSPLARTPPAAAALPIAPSVTPVPARGTTSATTVKPAAATTTPAATASACPPLPARAAPRADRSRYVVTADVDVARSLVTGTTEVRFTPDLTTDRIVFRLWPNSPALAAAGAHLDPGPVTVDGSTVATTRPDPTTLVAARGVEAGHTVTVALPWSLTVSRPASERTTKAGDSIRLGSFFPLLPWEPGHGWALDPATRVHGEASTAATADFDLTVIAPAGYGVLATGTEDRPGHWSAPAVEDLGVAIGHFRTATAIANAPGPVRVTVAADAGVADDPATYAAKAVKVIEQFGRRFGPYPWPSYTLAITPGLSGGIEYPMFVHTGPGAIGRSTSHEIGHQYFYGLVENDQGRDPWIDEALASWAEVGYEGTLANFRNRAVPAAGRGHAGEPTSFWDRIAADYYTSVYVQGVQALDALGPQDKVDCALAGYAAVNAYRIARPADVIDALTAMFPDAPAVLARYGIRP